MASLLRAAGLLLLAGAASAQTRSDLILRPMGEAENAELKLEINQYLESRTDAGFDYNMQVFAFAGRARLVPKLGRRSPRIGWDVLYLNPDTLDPRVPDELTESSIAVGAGYPIGGGWILGATLGGGFAGNRPFHGRGWYGLGSVSGTKRLDERNILQLGIDFDGNRPIFPDAPLPVVVWTRFWSEKVRTTIGFPFLGISWEPTERLELSFRGIPGIFQTGGFVFRPAKKWDLFVRYRGANFRFFIDEFENEHRRLFYTEQRVELGVTFRPSERVELILVFGWAFEREYSVGWDVRNKETLVGIDQGGLLGFTVSFGF